MKILNNRYKIDQSLYQNFFVEAYKVKDIFHHDDIKFLKVYHYNLQRDLIDYFIKNHLSIKKITHENIISPDYSTN